jgi:hypothetical protein
MGSGSAGGLLCTPARFPPSTRQAAWPDGLRDVIASIAAGRSLSQALNALAASGPAPLQAAFARFPMLSRMLGRVPALEVIKEELADPSMFDSHTHGSRWAHSEWRNVVQLPHGKGEIVP